MKLNDILNEFLNEILNDTLKKKQNETLKENLKKLSRNPHEGFKYQTVANTRQMVPGFRKQKQIKSYSPIVHPRTQLGSMLVFLYQIQVASVASHSATVGNCV